MTINQEDSSISATKQDIKSKGRSKKPNPSTSIKITEKPITSTALRSEHLDAAEMLLKAATVCALKEDEECENTAICVERVVADLMALTAAVAKALSLALERMDSGELDRMLLKRWCEFYSKRLLPETKSMMKKSSPILDSYGLFLPSRIGSSVNAELLERGLSISESDEGSAEGKNVDIKDDVTSMSSESSQTAAVLSMVDKVGENYNLKANDDFMESEELDDDNEDTGIEDSIVEEVEDDAPAISRSVGEPTPLKSNVDVTDGDDEYEYYDDDEVDVD